MEWLDQNLDAYRIVGEILNDLRKTLQEGLRRIHGPEWYRTGLPTEVFDRLVSTKEGETAIGWYEPEYQEIMDYAVFGDLLAILEHNREHFSSLMSIVPNPSLFAARFLELESLRNKIGRARPVSDAELTFLTRFLQRFRESLTVHNAKRTAEQSAPSPAPEKVEPKSVSAAVQIASSPVQPVAEKQSTLGRQPVVPPPRTDPNQDTATDRPARPPQRLQKTVPPKAQTKASEAPTQDESTPPEEVQPATLSAAIEKMDTKTILRELFREVTAVAESLWSTDVLPEPVVWKSVRRSQWYEKCYAPLGLKPLSDFFGVIGEVERRMSGGLAKHELQSLLEENNFAQVLLALRDMFQRNKI